MKGVDTNLLVRFLTRDDERQYRLASRAVASHAESGEPLRIDATVLCELVRVLESAYGYGRDEVASALEALDGAHPVEIEARDLARQATGNYREGGGGFSDHLLGLRNRRAGCETTLTFDRRLKRSELFEQI